MNLLAFDTSTETLSIAVQRGPQVFAHEAAGGAQASATLIEQALALLEQAQLAVAGLHAIAFGRGPGAFTGLRTACAVAQGLAWGAGVPVLPIDTLLAVAENARQRHGLARALAWLDARMGEVYAAPFIWQADAWRALDAARVCAPEELALPAGESAAGWALAGNAASTYGSRLPPALDSLPRLPAQPAATALLALAAPMLAAGQGLPAEQALPLYIRDKVAQTTAERLAARAAEAAKQKRAEQGRTEGRA